MNDGAYIRRAINSITTALRQPIIVAGADDRERSDLLAEIILGADTLDVERLRQVNRLVALYRLGLTITWRVAPP